MADQIGPTADDPSPLRLLAQVLQRIRLQLEGGMPPGWIAIAGGRYAGGGNTEGVSKVIGSITEFLLDCIAFGIRLHVLSWEWLTLGSAARALLRPAADMANFASSPAFLAALNILAGRNVGAPPALDMGWFTNAQGYLRFLPDEDDLTDLGHELYRLLCVEQTAPGADEEIDLLRTGCLRLLYWAYNKSYTVHELQNSSVKCFTLGARRLPSNGNWPQNSTRRYMLSGNTFEIYNITLARGDARDLVELSQILIAGGYNKDLTFDADKVITETSISETLKTMLKRFQASNGLLLTGRLDNATLNRLFHLDYDTKNVTRALPYNALKNAEVLETVTAGHITVNNHDAEAVSWLPGEGEKLSSFAAGPVEGAEGAQLAGTNEGWISATEGGPGFLVVQSRELQFTNPANPATAFFAGGNDSIGRASVGRFFFAAGLHEPNEPGKKFPPPGVTQRPAGRRSWLYQRLPLTEILADDRKDKDLWIKATVMFRSLYKQVHGRPGIYDQDQARLILASFPVVQKIKATDLADKPQNATDPTKPLVVFVGPSPNRPETEFPGAEKRRILDSQRVWLPLETPHLKVPPDHQMIVLMMEGIRNANWDTDVFFDTVRVHWTVKKPGSPVPAPKSPPLPPTVIK